DSLVAGSGITYATSTGTISLDNTGNWAGTFNGQNAAYYLNRTNHTGTQTASTISDFSTAADARIAAGTTTTRGMFSAGTGIDITSGVVSNTGVTSLGGPPGSISPSSLGLPTFADLAGYLT